MSSWKGDTWWVAEKDCPECGSDNTKTNGKVLVCEDCKIKFDSRKGYESVGRVEG